MINSPSSYYAAKNLIPGDILLLKDKTHHLVRHAAVVSHVDPESDKYLVIHEVRIANQPKALIEACLPPEAVMKERNLELEIFRTKDKNIASLAVTILKKWMLLGTLFGDDNLFKSHKRVNKYFKELFDVPFDNRKGQYPTVDRNQKYKDKLASFSEENHQDFQAHALDVVKYATRTELSPFRPDRDDKGFHCFQVMLTAYQAAFVSHLVHTQRDKWVSGKNDSELKPQQAIKAGYTLEDILKAIPKAFQIRAKYATGDLIEHWFETHGQDILNNLGFLEHLHPDRIPYKDDQNNKILTQFEEGKARRKKLSEKLGLSDKTEQHSAQIFKIA